MRPTKVDSQGYTFDLGGKSVTFVRVSRVLDHYYPIVYGSDEAMERGSAIHKATGLLDGLEPGRTLDWDTLDESLHGYVRAWERWKRESLAGGLKHSLLVDIKSGVPDPRHQLQTAAYKLAFRQEARQASVERFVYHPVLRYAGTLDRFYLGQRKPDMIRRACVYLRADGEYRMVWHDDPSDEAAFAGLVQAYHWDQKYAPKRGNLWS